MEALTVDGETHSDANSPAPALPSPARGASPVLCLSGGGFRATLFHLGVVRRLNEIGVLSRLSVVSSVSGGSILNGLLATRWRELKVEQDGVFGNFDDVLTDRVRRFCREDLRTPLLVGTRLNPLRWPELVVSLGAVSGNALARAYGSLLRRQMLSDVLPTSPGATPRFVFCATNVRTGACWHFHGGPGGRMGDFYTGYTETTGVSVAEAVAASSAFPPGIAAMRLGTAGRTFTRIDPWGDERPVSKKRKPLGDRAQRLALLTDGGVYDNLGVEPIWSRPGCLLVSDAGRPFSSRERCPQSLAPRLGRAAEISMDQVGAVRKRWLVDRFLRGERAGAIWAINTPTEDFGLNDANGYGSDCRDLFSAVRTDLNSFSLGEIGCLENHGYAIADAALRSRAASLCIGSPRPFQWPHPEWSGDDDARSALRGSGRRGIVRDICRYLTPRVSFYRSHTRADDISSGGWRGSN